MVFTLSATTLKLMKDCHTCFWWQVKKGIRRPTGPMSQLPNRIEEQIIARFDKFREEGTLPPELSELKRMILYKDKEKLNGWKNKGLKVAYDDEITITAKPDDILEHDGKIVILDYKTAGKRCNSCTEDKLIEDVEKYDYQLQLDLYNYVFRKAGIDTEDESYLLFIYIEGMDDDGKVILGSKLIKRDVDVKNAEDTILKAIDFLNEEEPPKDSCHFCASVESRANQ